MVQVGLLTPLTFTWHRSSPLAAFTSGAYFFTVEGGDSELAKSTVPSLKAHSPVVTCCLCYRMERTPHFFHILTIFCSAPKWCKDTVSLLESGEHRRTKAISNNNNEFVCVCAGFSRDETAGGRERQGCRLLLPLWAGSSRGLWRQDLSRILP